MENLEQILIEKEKMYGGYITNVPRNKVSIFDPRTEEQLKTGGMTGGDRMHNHGYAKKYAEYLKPFVDNGGAYVVAEVGILTGVGLAIWCDIFPKGKVFGFDIDLGHINDNMKNLLRLGAFKENKPLLYEFDQFVDNKEYLDTVLGGDKINIVIDDGFHSDESILKTMKSIVPHLAERFVYFVEDNDKVYEKIKIEFPEYNIEQNGELTIIYK